MIQPYTSIVRELRCVTALHSMRCGFLAQSGVANVVEHGGKWNKSASDAKKTRLTVGAYNVCKRGVFRAFLPLVPVKSIVVETHENCGAGRGNKM